ncbi:MAG: DNA-3-methyladenine glycosylase 2 family protein [Eubacteriales bacterium]
MAKFLASTKETDAYLIAKDEVFIKIINTCKSVHIVLADDCFASLTASIVGQQLSGKVADVIYARVNKLCNLNINPRIILELPVEKIRKAGLSYSKINYLKNLASAVEDKSIIFENIDALTNEEIIAMLTAVKGIGQWTAEMFLIFTLGREDVFSAGDGGLQRAVCQIYGIEEKPTKKQLEDISGNWKPYRTYASLYLWDTLNKKVN